MKYSNCQKTNLFSCLFVAILVAGISCTKNESSEKYLARIGNKMISPSEFMKRAELTVRPQNFNDKETVLNNLITEKILALEAGENNELVQNPLFQGQIRGMKEQKMREKLFYQEAWNKVKLDTNEIKKAYKLSMREYRVEFYTINNEGIAEKIKDRIKAKPNAIADIFEELGEGRQTPEHKIKWRDPEPDVIHEALFSEPLQQGQAIGPLKLEDGSHIVMRVLDWLNYPIIGGEEIQIRWQEVTEKLRQIKANKIWRNYMANVMKGKKIEFNNESFYFLSEMYLYQYFSSQNRNALKNVAEEIPPIKIEERLDDPFFTIDNEVWTIGDFKRAIMSHPLVYRPQNINKSNFRDQFKYAIADMIRDHYLNQKAYKKSLDEDHDVKETVEMWKDAQLALYHRNQILISAKERNMINENRIDINNKYWITYLDSLHMKYENHIKINHEEFKKINLTNINMFAMKQSVPYPIAVPGFPLFTNSATLNYGKEKGVN